MSLSLKTRVSFLVALVTIAATAIGTLFFISAHNKSIRREMIARGTALSLALSKASEDGAAKENLNLVEKASYIVRGEDVTLVQVLTPFWQPIASYPSEKFDDPAAPEAIGHFKVSDSPFHIALTDSIEFYAPISIRPFVEAPPIPVGFTRIKLSTTIMRTAIRNAVISNVAVSMMLSILAILTLRSFIEQLVINPILSLHKSVKGVKNGRAPEPVKGAEEIRELAAEYDRISIDIGDREKRLQQERDKVRNYLNIAGVIMVAIEADMRVSLINRKGCEILGFREDEIVGKNWFETFIPEQSREKVLAVFTELMSGAGKELEYFENPVLTKDGRERMIAWRNSAMTDQNGAITGTLSSGEDITERRLAEDAAQHRNQQLQTLSHATRLINTVLEIPVVLQRMVAAAMELTGATAGTSGLLVNWEMIFSEYNDRGNIIPFDYRFSPNMGVAGWVMKNKVPYVCKEAVRDPLVIPEIREKFGLYNLVNVPLLRRDGELLGCMEIHNKAGRRPFNEHDLELLEALSASAAGALENARLLSERKQAEEGIRRLNIELEQRVKERTAELERMNRLFVGRELRMQELKERVKELETKVEGA